MEVAATAVPVLGGLKCVGWVGVWGCIGDTKACHVVLAVAGAAGARPSLVLRPQRCTWEAAPALYHSGLPAGAPGPAAATPLQPLTTGAVTSAPRPPASALCARAPLPSPPR